MKQSEFLLRILARLIIPNKNFAEIFELEAKRKLGKSGCGETVELEVQTALNFSDGNIKAEPLVIFDIGANFGLYTGKILENVSNVQVVAFEPSMFAFSVLLEKYSSDERVTLVNTALGDENKTTSLHFDKSGSGLASLTKRNLDHIGIAFDGAESIRMITARNWIESNGLVPYFVKIDVEGHELEVLNGFDDYLEEIHLIQFEFGGCNIDTRTYFKDYWLLFKNSFNLYRITPHGADLISEYSENEESFMTSNYLAVRNI